MSIREYFEKQRKLRDTSVRAYMICLTKLRKSISIFETIKINNQAFVYDCCEPSIKIG